MKITEPRYVVWASDSTPGKLYRVYLNGVCECKGWIYTKDCHHLKQVRALGLIKPERENPPSD